MLHREGDGYKCPLLLLPPELIDSILVHLTAPELSFVSATCRGLYKQAGSDFHWRRCVQDNVPDVTLSSPGPCESFKELYVAHDPVWFLPRYRIWFGDLDWVGKLIVVRFDPRRGCIEGYQLVAVNNKPTSEQWSDNSNVTVHGFEPLVRIHLDRPVLQLNIPHGQEVRHGVEGSRANRFAAERPMMRGDGTDPMLTNFQLLRPMHPLTAVSKCTLPYPYDHVWPSPLMPASHYVSGVRLRSHSPVAKFPSDDVPWSRSEVSDKTFRIRQWMQMPGTPALPSLTGGHTAGVARLFNDILTELDYTGVQAGGEVITYSTLDPALYAPTESKPWRGIWVGDYNGHGCEFLLMLQPDDAAVTDTDLGLVKGEDETDEAWSKRRRDAHMYRGRLEAVKLTGDPNVPRGEVTFFVDDLGPEGYVGTASKPPFEGARIVKSKGVVAGLGFVRERYVDCQLLLIGPNRLAQYWKGLRHISFFERVQLDQLVAPS